MAGDLHPFMVQIEALTHFAFVAQSLLPVALVIKYLSSRARTTPGPDGVVEESQAVCLLCFELQRDEKCSRSIKTSGLWS